MYILKYISLYAEELHDMHTAKVFQNGRSQAVRLPKEFRFSCKTVSVSHLGNAVLLQPVYETWMDVYNAMSGLSEEDFVSMMEMEDLPLEEREQL